MTEVQEAWRQARAGVGGGCSGWGTTVPSGNTGWSLTLWGDGAHPIPGRQKPAQKQVANSKSQESSINCLLDTTSTNYI